MSGSTKICPHSEYKDDRHDWEIVAWPSTSLLVAPDRARFYLESCKRCPSFRVQCEQLAIDHVFWVGPAKGQSS